MFRVLAVDDDPLLLRLYVRALHDMTVVTLTDPRAALALLTTCAPGAYDIVLLDQDMAGLTGLCLARQLFDRRNPHADRVLFVTGTPEVVEASELPCPALGKPFSVSELRAAVDSVARVHLVA